jgi:hypothetical protein
MTMALSTTDQVGRVRDIIVAAVAGAVIAAVVLIMIGR